MDTGTTLGMVRWPPGMTEVVRFVFYFDGPHQACRQQAETIIRAFCARIGPARLATGFDLEGESFELTDQSLEQQLFDWFQGACSEWPNASIELGGHEFDGPPFGLVYWGKGLGDPVYPDNRGFLDIWVSAQFFSDEAVELRHLFFQAANSDRISCAWADVSITGGTPLAKQAMASRYRGLDISRTKSASMDVGDLVAGAHLWTVIGRPILERLRERPDFGRELAGLASVETTASGIVNILLGDTPRLGDVNRQEQLVPHRAFASVLDDLDLLHVPISGRYFLDKEKLPDLEAQATWHRRFLEEPNGGETSGDA